MGSPDGTSQRSNHDGEAGSFVYSAYGSPRAYLSPAPSSDPDVASEALELHFEAPGFTGRTVYHRPKYEKVVYEGQEYLYTRAAQTRLSVPERSDRFGP